MGQLPRGAARAIGDGDKPWLHVLKRLNRFEQAETGCDILRREEFERDIGRFGHGVVLTVWSGLVSRLGM